MLELLDRVQLDRDCHIVVRVFQGLCPRERIRAMRSCTGITFVTNLCVFSRLKDGLVSLDFHEARGSLAT